jgi:glycolate oxidase iron-sulfur subunit
MVPGAGADCCGALHGHAGRTAQARALAERVMHSMPGDAPIVVDSAGCGAAMKDYGHLLGTAEARAFAERVVDFAEWLAARPALALRPTGRTVVVQDPCHLRHVQKAHMAVRAVLSPAYALVEPGDEGLCCGAGGAYSALQPELSRAVRDRKVEAIRAVGGTSPVVASANPGCLAYLQAAGLDVRHPAELVAHALDPTREGVAR